MKKSRKSKLTEEMKTLPLITVAVNTEGIHYSIILDLIEDEERMHATMQLLFDNLEETITRLFYRGVSRGITIPDKESELEPATTADGKVLHPAPQTRH
ncbi:hypothetical protein Bealeia1_01962 (plasmid) [Candidatus Bealeia paramacronuclearis]|uniref:Uncharacterized protein n=1 Tax=Candidatus Bealeia paramacronuclearis TaxID=1921001 RepID=A0ABZ2C6Z8_9PROT|nr:hypothetical protein [Candidatus Bealeia paramacronuclearis]